METKEYCIEVCGESYGSDIVSLTEEEYKKFSNILNNCSSEYISCTISECPDIDKIIIDLNIKSPDDFSYMTIHNYFYNNRTYNFGFVAYVYEKLKERFK